MEVIKGKRVRALLKIIEKLKKVLWAELAVKY